MNKKLLGGIIIAVVVVALIVVAYFVFGTKDNAKTLDLAKISTEITNAGFSEMASMEVDTEILSSYFQVDGSNVVAVYGKIPMMNVHASLYVLVEAAEGQAEVVKQQLETFGTSYEQQWARYLPEQYELVQNRKIGTIGNYVYMVISENADKLLDLIK